MIGTWARIQTNTMSLFAKCFKVTDSRNNWHELFKIFDLVRKKKLSTGRPAIPMLSTTARQLYPVPLDPTSDFQIWALAPSGRQIERYEETLRRCFDSDGRLVQDLAQSSHNIISMALLVIHGNTRIILGGDVESAGWRNVMEEYLNPSAHVVKVSHHGSAAYALSIFAVAH